jgi:uncharacterized membrane protein YhaH (DUF805 family)
VSGAAIVVLAILFMRWVLPPLWQFLTQQNGATVGFAKRGRVLGHRGPNPRSFKGRAGRREWWLTMLGTTIISAIIGAIPTIGALLTLPWVIVTLAVNARRLHDLSLSAWLQLIPMAFGLVFAVFYFVLGGPDNPPDASWAFSTPAGMLTAYGALAALVYLAFYIWIGFVPGRQGPNVYGEADPV